MEATQRRCPVCEQPLAFNDGFFVCGDHGNWYSYSDNLLVRAPGNEAKATERVVMPWERLVPAV